MSTTPSDNSKKLRLDIAQVSSVFLPYWKSVLVKCLKMIHVFTFDDIVLWKFVPDDLWSWFITVYRSANIFQSISIHSSCVKWRRPGLTPQVFSSPLAIIARPDSIREILVWNKASKGQLSVLCGMLFFTFKNSLSCRFVIKLVSSNPRQINNWVWLSRMNMWLFM